MSDYKTYIQKGADARKILATYGISLKHIPFDLFPELKDLPSHDWPDEQGTDVFRPANPVFKAKTCDLELAYIGATGTGNQMFYSFFQYVAGGSFDVFDEFSKRGFRCAYKSIKDDGLYRKEEDVLEFSLTVDIDNPLSYGLSLTGITNFVALAECDLTVYWADGTTVAYSSGATITKTIITGNEFMIVVPDAMGIVTPINYADSPTRLTDVGYLRILSSTGVRYVEI